MPLQGIQEMISSIYNCFQTQTILSDLNYSVYFYDNISLVWTMHG